METPYNNPDISTYLSHYPVGHRLSCATALTIIGINTLHRSFLPLKDLWYIANSPPSPLQHQLSLLKQELSTYQKLSEPRKRPRQKSTKPNETPRFRENGITYKCSSPKPVKPSSKSPFKQTPKSRNTSPLQRNIPRYLQHIDSKIRGDVRKDIALYKTLLKDEATSRLYESRYNKENRAPSRDPEFPHINLTELFQSEAPTQISEIEVQTSYDIPRSKATTEQTTQFPPRTVTILDSSEPSNLYLEGTFTLLEHSAKEEFPFDKDFETPRYPAEPRRSELLKESSEVLNIATHFLNDPFLASLCGAQDSSEFSSNECIKSQPVPPLDLFTSHSSGPIHRDEFNRIHKLSKDTSSRRVTSPMQLYSPSPSPSLYEGKFMGPMYQDIEYRNFFNK